MRKSIYLPVFVLAVAVALATSQTNSPSSSTNQSSPPKQTNSVGNDQPPSATTQTGSSASSPGDAQSQIQNAMKNDARLSQDNIMVSVSGSDIDLTGEVNSKEEKKAASKIAERYAGGLNIKNHLQVRGEKGSSDSGSPENTTTPLNNKRGIIAGDPGGNSGTTVAGATTAMHDPPGNGTAEPMSNHAFVNGGSSFADSTEGQAGQPDSGTSASDLQAQIQNALKNEPTLSNDKVNVSVLDDEIDLSGSVATSKEKLTAQRIVQSYAENRKVNDRLTVSGHKAGTSPAQNAGNPAPTRDNSNPPPR
jgi:osmotically-inducible protein OsmY